MLNKGMDEWVDGMCLHCQTGFNSQFHFLVVALPKSLNLIFLICKTAIMISFLLPKWKEKDTDFLSVILIRNSELGLELGSPDS